MTTERWKELMNNGTLALTAEELSQGWHWCGGWDDLLVGPGMMEWEHCDCVGIKDTLPLGHGCEFCGRPATKVEFYEDQTYVCDYCSCY